MDEKKRPYQLIGIAGVIIVVILLALLLLRSRGAAPVRPIGPVVPPRPTGEVVITTPSQAPRDALKLEVSGKKGFAPKELRAKAGAKMTLVLTSKDNETHVLVFQGPELREFSLGVRAQETRMTPFDVPAKKGKYVFYSEVPGQRARGEEGTLIVE